MSPTLADLTWCEVGFAAQPQILAVPVGATEQHGPHLPLSTDTDIAVALAQRLARERPEVIVAPAVSYGSSGEHASFPGTLSIGQEAIEHLLVELGRSATRSFARVVLISTHGGNAAAVQRAERRLREEDRDVRAYFPRWKGDAHAGRLETSVMLALHPDRVSLALAQRGATGAIADLMPVLRERGVRAVSENGVLGDPAGASAAEGHELLQAVHEHLITQLDDWYGPQQRSGPQRTRTAAR